MSAWVLFLAQLAILAYALVGGVFLAFSDFIMRSLDKTSGAGGIEAMQSINREVMRWVFMTLFLGLAPVSLFFCVYGIFWAENLAGVPLVVAGALYLIGCFAVTVFGNVPMNTALDKLEAPTPEAEIYWRQTYLPRWTMLNTMRTVACVISASVLVFGLFARAV
ncbi:MAG: anthrone oxygenase family protein [Pseudomonadota bacterium]